MLAPEKSHLEPSHDSELAADGLLAEEVEFYEGYAWSLNPHLLVREAVEHLGDELAKLAVTPGGWQTREVVTNVYLLSCALLNCLDEYLRGPGLRLPARLAEMRVGRAARWAEENLLLHRRPRKQARMREWRERCARALGDFASLAISEQGSDPRLFAASAAELSRLLDAPLPLELQSERIGIPSPFRRLDLTQHDVLALGQRYAQRFPDRSEAILLVGLRTSGSYFVPLLRAFLTGQGYTSVSMLTLTPSKGLDRRERQALKNYSQQGYTAVIVDDPPHTGGAIFTALGMVRQQGFGHGKARVLVPIHPARRHLFKTFPDDLVVSLEPEQWHKRALLDAKLVEERLSEYFAQRNYARTSVVMSERVAQMNAALQNGVSDERGARLKQIFEIELERHHGGKETRYVLAKSVGWGWLGYHAFLAGQRLSGFVPPMLGLRDGILYMEWLPDSAADLDTARDANTRIDAAASYIAARTRYLSLATGSPTGKDPPRQNNGVGLLCEALGKAYGSFPLNLLMQPRSARMLRRQPCPFPTFIDGNMLREEWIAGSRGLLKTDYEHHGLGKEELNVVDPAYDLADTILNWRLSADEEHRLIRRYIKETEDLGVEQRLPIYKLLAGLWAMKRAHDQLFGKASGSKAQEVLHQRFMTAWDFLTVQTARHCGRLCRPRTAPQWRAPLVAIDIDGVLDRRLLGFPSTTAAGIEALSLLHDHGLSIAVNTARSVSEVKAYCDAYSLAGGIAEHGSYLWDAVNQRGMAVIDARAAAQIDELRRALQRIPGIFLDDRHQYSIRAFVYRDKPRGLKGKLLNFIRSSGFGDGVVAPLPSLLIRQLMTELKLDLLTYHHNVIDTTIVSKQVNKGTGLVALRDWVLTEDAETVAVGDQEPDLTMFRVAGRSFAPANIGCAPEARLLGCAIVRHAYQRGLLEIARHLVRPSLQDRDAHERKTTAPEPGRDLIMDALRAADETWTKNLLAAIFGSAFRKVSHSGLMSRLRLIVR